jgi:hypothetical protein
MQSDRSGFFAGLSTSGTYARLAAAVLLVALGWNGQARADDSGNFIVRLGQDTTSVEHYNSTPARIEVDQIGRSPRVLRRHFTYDFVDGAISHFSMVVTPPGTTTPTQTIEASFDSDSARVRTQSGSSPAQKTTLVVPRGTVVVTNTSPWVGYQSAIEKLLKAKQDSLRAPLWFVGSPSTTWLTVCKMERDSVALITDRGDVFHIHVDKSGHILGVKPIAGTGQFSVQRVAHLDLEAMAATYSARERAGAGLGMLSPRDTVRVADVAGASLMIDYGRPAKRGRVVFGGVVPYGRVWRTGANAATQFKTDKALDFGGTIVPAGFYTLWTLPSATGWKLIINGETGQWGTEHKAEKDLYTIDMQVSTLPQPAERFTIRVEEAPQGGRLVLEWDTMRASAGFVVQR